MNLNIDIAALSGELGFPETGCIRQEVGKSI
jgi:hypothetical protein